MKRINKIFRTIFKPLNLFRSTCTISKTWERINLVKYLFTVILWYPLSLFAQQDLLPVYYPDEIKDYSGFTTYFNNSPFTGILIYKSTNKKIGEFSNGKKVGLFTEYYSNENKKSESNFINGKQEGKGIHYHNNGQIKVTYNYYGGKIVVGTYPVYNENGVIEKEEQYKYQVCHTCKGDGKRNCFACSGKGKLSCQYCSKGKVNCNNCYGKGALRCSVCRGEGKTSTCPKCNGQGKVTTNMGILVMTSTCMNCNGSGRGDFRCNKCNGDGKIDCYSCFGRGTINCSYCSGNSFNTCGSCNGSGKTTGSCPSCDGTGNSSEILMTVEYK
ncbi:MAG: hypothetical protein ABII90_07650 [Bacteroidota bacterium]